MADFSASAPMGTFQPGTAAAATSIVELSMAARYVRQIMSYELCSLI